MSSEANLVLMDADRISRSLNRMAHEVAEQNTADQPILLFGIDKRGYAVSKALASLLSPMFKDQVQTLQLPLKEGEPDHVFDNISEEANNHFLIIVDDVIFSGQTMFTALKKITNHVNPSEIHTAALIDRGHRKFPVKAEFYGMELPTKLDEHVSVIVDDGNIKEVVLVDSDK